MIVTLIILGQPCSKSNTSQIVKLGDRYSLGSSKEKKAYERGALPQIPVACRVRLEGPVCVTMRLWYRDERSDLDESLILDVLQDRYETRTVAGLRGGGFQRDRLLVQCGVYRNDRQVREKHILWGGVDKANPRAIIRVEPMQAQQVALTLTQREIANEEFFSGL